MFPKPRVKILHIDPDDFEMTGKVQKKSCAQKDMARLYKSFGEEGVLELLRNACSANDAPPSGEQKAG